MWGPEGQAIQAKRFHHKTQVLGFHVHDVVPVRTQLSPFSVPAKVTMAPIGMNNSAGAEHRQVSRASWQEAHNSF